MPNKGIAAAGVDEMVIFLKLIQEMAQYYTDRFPDEILVYLESYDKRGGNVLFDFIDSNEFDSFNIILNLNPLKSPSMVFVSGYYLKPVRENTIYTIKKETINRLNEQGLIVQNLEGSFIIGYQLLLNDTIESLFEHSVALNETEIFFRNVYVPRTGDVNHIPSMIKGRLSFKIRNVEQANWNELYLNHKAWIIYDAGAPFLAGRKEVLHMIENREDLYRSDSPGLFISHWDVDHYHSLVAMSDETIKRFAFVVCRDHLPTLTSRILFGRFSALLSSDKVFSISAGPSVKGSTPLTLISDPNNQILIFVGHEHKDRNRSGIVLVIRTANSNVIFSGDVHYHQLSEYVLPYIGYPGRHYLVVPHHGGNAGKFSYEVESKAKMASAIISVGKNPYGHPFKKNTDSLNRLGFSILKTNILRSDIEVDMQD